MSPSDAGPDPNNPEPKKKTSAAQIGSIVGIVVGIVGFQAVAPKLFPRQPGDGFNFTQMFVAAGVGAVCAVLGFLIGALIDRARKG
jgi:hypothetical protein